MSVHATIPRYTERRRSPRVSARLLLVVCDGEGLQEQTCTSAVNAHGALVHLTAKVTVGQPVVIHNPDNWAERQGRVTSVGRRYAGRTEVGIEFTEPVPDFWLINTISG